MSDQESQDAAKIVAEIDVMLSDGRDFDGIIEALVKSHDAKVNLAGDMKTLSCCGIVGSSRKSSAISLIASWRGAAERKVGAARNDTPPEGLQADERLRLLVERFERLDEEQKGIGQDKADVLAEARAVGYDRVGFKEVIRLRRLSPDDRAERDHIVDLYRGALGV